MRRNDAIEKRQITRPFFRPHLRINQAAYQRLLTALQFMQDRIDYVAYVYVRLLTIGWLMYFVFMLLCVCVLSSFETDAPSGAKTIQIRLKNFCVKLGFS